MKMIWVALALAFLMVLFYAQYGCTISFYKAYPEKAN